MKRDVTEMYNALSKNYESRFQESGDLHTFVINRLVELLFDSGEAKKGSNVTFSDENNKLIMEFDSARDANVVIGSYKVIYESLSHYTTKIGADYQFILCSCMACINLRALFVELKEIGITISHCGLELN